MGTFHLLILYFLRRHYVERIILCNSLVWSCELTGKKNMTYKEALDCELESKRMLNDFPTQVLVMRNIVISFYYILVNLYFYF